MLRDRFLKRLLIITLGLAVILPLMLSGLGKIGPAGTGMPFLPAPGTPPALTNAAIVHILHGDGRGGGHLHGTGRACKTEFPAAWDAEKIVAAIETLAANDNMPWRAESNGYHVAEAAVDGVKIRVVLDETRERVITAYPVSLPRNPCPASAANDNNDTDEKTIQTPDR